jgi:thiol-disulfide isomerase/thioredoxin
MLPNPAYKGTMDPVKRNASIHGLLGLCLAVALISSACGGSHNPTVSGDIVIRLPSTPTELPTYTPAQFRQLLSSLKGSPVVVNIWASWCGPCIQEAPELAKAAHDYQGRIQFLGIDIQDHLAAARTFIRRFGWTYPSVFDVTGAIRDDLGITGQPNTILFDASGQRTFVWSGAIDRASLRQELAKVLASGGGM